LAIAGWFRLTLKPAGRTIYVQALNQIAVKLGSELRAYAYDRPGMHNPLLILFRGKDSQTDHESCNQVLKRLP
jgi:hypothetical protein